jgi:hypothetical protein
MTRLAYFHVLEVLTMAPEEGESVQMDIPFHGQAFQFPREHNRLI